MWPGASGGLGSETQGVPSSPLFLCFNFPQRYLEIPHGDVSQLVKDTAQRRKRNKQRLSSPDVCYYFIPNSQEMNNHLVLTGTH